MKGIKKRLLIIFEYIQIFAKSIIKVLLCSAYLAIRIFFWITWLFIPVACAVEIALLSVPYFIIWILVGKNYWSFIPDLLQEIYDGIDYYLDRLKYKLLNIGKDEVC